LGLGDSMSLTLLYWINSVGGCLSKKRVCGIKLSWQGTVT